MIVWAITYYAVLVLSAVIGILLWAKPKRFKRLWLVLLCWVPLWLLAGNFIRTFTGYWMFRYDPRFAVGWFAWTEPWYPHMNGLRWALLVVTLFCWVVALMLKPKYRVAKFCFSLAALAVTTWFVMLATPLMVRWMWVILLVGTAANMLLRKGQVRRTIVKVCGLLLLVFGLLSENWLLHDDPGRVPAPGSQSALSIQVDSVLNGVVTMEVPKQDVPKA